VREGKKTPAESKAVCEKIISEAQKIEARQRELNIGAPGLSHTLRISAQVTADTLGESRFFLLKVLEGLKSVTAL
jgi:hypothetical protein